MTPHPIRPRMRRTALTACARPAGAAVAALALALGACRATPTPVADVPPPDAVPAAGVSTTAAATPTADALPTPSPVEALIAALAGRDYAALEAMMDDPFVLGLYRSEGRTLPPTEARASLEADALPPGAAPVVTTADRIAFPAVDPPLETMFDPALRVHQLLFSRGWGADGQGEAVLVLAERPDGAVTWHGVVVAPAGFGGADAGAGAGTPVAGDGFVVDAPDGWTADDSAGGVILTSFAPAAAGHGGIDAGQTKIDILPLAADPAPTTLDAAVAAVRAGDPSAAWTAGRIRTASGLDGMRLATAAATAAVVDLGGAFVVASCYGEGCAAGGVFDAVVASIRVE